MLPLLATVILDPGTAMIGGAAIAFFSARLIQANPEVEIRRTMLLAGAWGVIWGISVGFMYFNYKDWMLAYLMDGEKLPTVPTYLLFVFMLFVHAALAALGISMLVVRKKLGLALAITLAISVSNILTTLLQSHAYQHVGTFAEYWAGQAKEVSEVPRAQMGMTVSGAIAAPSAIAIVVWRFIKGRKTPRA
jgi:hypothetical protein